MEDKLVKIYFDGDAWIDGNVFHQKTTLEEMYYESDDNEKKKILKWCKENPEYADALSDLKGWWRNA